MFDALFKHTLAPLALRLALAAIFLFHGWDKISEKDNNWGASWARTLWLNQQKMPPDVKEKVAQGLKSERDRLLEEKFPPDVKESLKQLNKEAEGAINKAYADEAGEMPVALGHNAAQLAVAWGEFVGGIAMLLGMLTRPAALGLIVIQVGAIMIVTYQMGFSAAGGIGYEYNVAIIAMCLALVFLGGGYLSVDGMVRRRPKKG